MQQAFQLTVVVQVQMAKMFTSGILIQPMQTSNGKK